MSLDYLAIGHIAQDVAPEGFRLGGTAAFSALTAHALGQRVGIVTAAAADAVTDGLEAIALRCLPSAHSTIYENVYTPTGRVQTLHAEAERLTYTAVPEDWRAAAIVHLGPIANEVDPALATQFPNSFVGLTPQGWMRRWGADRRVYRGEWAEADQLLPAASATVISIEDVDGDWATAERWAGLARILVVTQGEQGATIYWKNERRSFPAPSVSIVDATGAGDIFAACFFVRLWQTGDPWQAAQFAIALASDSITRAGIAGVPTPEHLQQLRLTP